MEFVELTAPADIKRQIQLLYSELFGSDAVPGDDVFEDIFRQHQEANIYHVAYGLMQENEVLAFFTLSEAFSVFAHGRYGVLNELWVHKDYRSQGLGQLVIEKVRELGRSRSWKRIDVTAPPGSDWDRTFEFYQRNGFKLTGRKLKTYL